MNILLIEVSRPQAMGLLQRFINRVHAFSNDQIMETGFGYQKFCIGAVFIDFQKAFDPVSHLILSCKLQVIGISGSVHDRVYYVLSHI